MNQTEFVVSLCRYIVDLETESKLSQDNLCARLDKALSAERRLMEQVANLQGELDQMIAAESRARTDLNIAARQFHDLEDEFNKLDKIYQELRATRPGTYQEGLDEAFRDGTIEVIRRLRKVVSESIMRQTTLVSPLKVVYNEVISRTKSCTVVQIPDNLGEMGPGEVVPVPDSRCICGAVGPPFQHLPPYPCGHIGPRQPGG